MNDYTLTDYDFNSTNSYSAVQGDRNSRGLRVMVPNSVEDEKLDVILYWSHSDGNNGISTTQFNPETVTYDLFYPEEMLRRGQVQATLQIVNSEMDTIVNSRMFKIIVNENAIKDDALQAENNYTTLNEILIEWHTLPDKVNVELAKLPEMVNTSVDELLPEIVKDLEIDGVTETPESIKEKYETNENTNAFTDDDKDNIQNTANDLGLLNLRVSDLNEEVEQVDQDVATFQELLNNKVDQDDLPSIGYYESKTLAQNAPADVLAFSYE